MSGINLVDALFYIVLLVGVYCIGYVRGHRAGVVDGAKRTGTLAE